MFLMEEALAPDGGCLAVVCMREDGLFEGRLYRTARRAVEDGEGPQTCGDNYEICGVAETLSRIQTIVYEELGLTKTAG